MWHLLPISLSYLWVEKLMHLQKRGRREEERQES